MLKVILVWCVTQVPPMPGMMPDPAQAPKGPPPHLETARLYFVAGDLRRAGEFIDRCLQSPEKKKCLPIKRALAEYSYLASQRDSLTAAQARQVLEFDRQISPQKVGKLTQVVSEQWVGRPTRIAQSRFEAGQLTAARASLDEALAVDPLNVEALAVKARIDNAADAGVADAGAAAAPVKSKP